MLALVCFFQRIAWPLGVVVVATGAFAVVRPCLQQRTPSPGEERRRSEKISHVQAQVAIDPQVVDSTVLPAAQIAASLAGSVAIAPQLWRNALRGASGEFSPVSASMLAAGNAGRLWTTTVLTQDPLLLGGFALGCGSHPAAQMMALSLDACSNSCGGCALIHRDTPHRQPCCKLAAGRTNSILCLPRRSVAYWRASHPLR